MSGGMEARQLTLSIPRFEANILWGGLKIWCVLKKSMVAKDVSRFQKNILKTNDLSWENDELFNFVGEKRTQIKACAGEDLSPGV